MKNFQKTRAGFSLIELSVVIIIIGVLVAGIIQGAKIIKKSRLQTAQTLTQSSRNMEVFLTKVKKN